jgi:hypothetical protein
MATYAVAAVRCPAADFAPIGTSRMTQKSENLQVTPKTGYQGSVQKSESLQVTPKTGYQGSVDQGSVNQGSKPKKKDLDLRRRR